MIRRQEHVRIVVVGQTPPPLHGQALMIQHMLDGDYGQYVELFHVRMAFSRSMDEIGTFQLRKAVELFRVIAKLVAMRFSRHANVLYFPPSGPNKMGVLRDLAILLPTRWLFKKTVLHFHAGGLGELIEDLSWPVRAICRLAYGSPDLAIRISEDAPRDGEAVKAKQNEVVPNGIEDLYSEYRRERTAEVSGPVSILFVGVLTASKGILVLLDACRRLRETGAEFELRLMGEFDSSGFETEVHESIRQNGLTSQVAFLGRLSGEEKWREYANADIFCMPTFYENETFGVVYLEAMMLEVPIVATRWRGVPSVVQDNVCGFLVPIKDPEALAKKLEVLARDCDLREKMGKAGRCRFLSHFTLERHREELRRVFQGLG